MLYHLALIDQTFLLQKKFVPTVENWQNTALKIKIVCKYGDFFLRILGLISTSNIVSKQSSNFN